MMGRHRQPQGVHIMARSSDPDDWGDDEIPPIPGDDEIPPIPDDSEIPPIPEDDEIPPIPWPWKEAPGEGQS